MKYWLLKSEPESYSIDDLARDEVTPWEGVRNYQARNYMWKEMQVGDLAFFYHSNAAPPGVVGLMKIASEAHPDQSAFEKKGDYFDPKSSPEKPAWHCVNVEFLEKFTQVVSLESLKAEKALSNMLVLKRGMRLSVQPLLPADFLKVCQLAQSKVLKNLPL